MKKYNCIIINGKFLSQRITGVQRYAIETVKELDKIANQIALPIILAVPNNANMTLFILNKIKISVVGKLSGIKWEQIELAKFIKKNNGLGLHLCNSIPIFSSKGFLCIHDITYKLNPQFATTKQLKLARIWNLIQYKIGSKKSRHLFTVSEFSKNQISKTYKINPNKITVAYNGWQHFNTKIDAPDTLETFPMLKDKSYYFSLSTMAKNKNFSWIVESALKNPDSTYVVAGKIDIKKLGNNLGTNLPNNLYCLGYINDKDAKILMKHCKAFLFPSLYEGFGIPPLEALAMGAKVICSNTSCLPEIFEDTVYYIDPQNSNVILDELIDNNISSPKKILEKYSWKKTAEIYKNEINNFFMNNELI